MTLFQSHTRRHMIIVFTILQRGLGAQWLSGRALDSRPKGRGFEPHRRHCVVSLSKNINNPNLVQVQPRKIRPFITERLLMGRKESNQTKTKNSKRPEITVYYSIWQIRLVILNKKITLLLLFTWNSKPC